MITEWAWLILNFYLLISLCAILFDFYVMLTADAHDRRQQKRKERLSTLLQKQLDRIREGQALDESVQKELYSRLCNIEDVLSMSEIAEEYSSRKDADFAAFLAQSGALIARLCQRYAKRQKMVRASFAWFLAACSQKLPTADGFLLDCASQAGSIYCRENAMMAFYRSGNENLVIQALKLMSKRDIHHSQKLLADGFLTFQGEQEGFCFQLWQNFKSFSPEIRLAVVDFMRLKNADYRKQLLPLLEDPKTDDELCFAILRYFGRCADENACQIMMRFLEEPRNQLWEYAAVSASALRIYHHEKAVGALAQALTSHSWYVRYNAAECLVYMHLPEQVYDQLLQAEDPYAKDILGYMLRRRQIMFAGGNPTAAKEV